MAQEDYIVSARKYRPTTFKSVVGQQHITHTLQNAIRTGQLAQAFLFCGPRGVGKTTCARILAKTINCTSRTEDVEPCNECQSCKSFNENAAFNVIELDAASNNSVDDIRSLVEQVYIPPQGQKYKVYIIDEVHMLTTSAFNAFLKTLEEPPAWAKFILATTEKNKILPTILSRCQIFDFHRIKTEDIAKHLEYIAKQEEVNYEPQALHIIAEKADGGLRDALSMFDQLVSFTCSNLTYKNIIDNLDILDYNYYFKFVDSLLECNIQKTLLLFNEVLEKGFEGNNFINGLSNHLRSLLVGKDAQTVSLLDVADDVKAKYITQSAKTPMIFLLRALDFANTCQIEYRTTSNKRLCVELTLLKIANIMNKIAPSQKQNSNTAKKDLSQSKEEKDSEAHPKEPLSPITEIVNQSPKQTVESPKKAHKIELVLPTKPSISINTALEETLKAVEKEKEKENPTIKALDWNLFEEKIKQYAENISKYDQNLYFLLITCNFEPTEDNGVIICLKNTQQEEEFNLVSSYIVKFLRKETGCTNFHFIIKITQNNSHPRLDSLQDKFQFLATKSPAIRKLRESFDCKIDY